VLRFWRLEVANWAGCALGITVRRRERLFGVSWLPFWTRGFTVLTFHVPPGRGEKEPPAGLQWEPLPGQELAVPDVKFLAVDVVGIGGRKVRAKKEWRVKLAEYVEIKVLVHYRPRSCAEGKL
jgi:hypothetical protein